MTNITRHTSQRMRAKTFEGGDGAGFHLPGAVGIKLLCEMAHATLVGSDKAPRPVDPVRGLPSGWRASKKRANPTHSTPAGTRQACIKAEHVKDKIDERTSASIIPSKGPHASWALPLSACPSGLRECTLLALSDTALSDAPESCNVTRSGPDQGSSCLRKIVFQAHHPME
ncbi:uncharacterized protein PG998_011383 [Apiospora kogelbergensis]|uniref:Uncharacterized protein n=1 Tax=Apiospora kogelbergensis TaxID=1337665 RepID=A0AAW0RC51_9PEZI